MVVLELKPKALHAFTLHSTPGSHPALHVAFCNSTELMGSAAFRILDRGSLGTTVQLEVRAQGTRFEVVSVFKVFLYAINFLTALLKQHQLKENPLFSFLNFSLGEDGNCKILKDSC